MMKIVTRGSVLSSFLLTSATGFSLVAFSSPQHTKPVSDDVYTKSYHNAPQRTKTTQLRNSDKDYVPSENDAARSSKLFGVTLKIAVDRNGGVAELDTSESERFTSPESLDMVHRLRRDSDAVLVGRGTVQADNPSLTVRRVEPRSDPQSGQPIQPLRVILDPSFTLGLEEFSSEHSYHIFTDGLATTVYHTLDDVDVESLAILDTVDFVQLPALTVEQNARLLTVPSSAAPLPSTEASTPSTKLLPVASVLSDLSQRYHVQHLMVEGGPVTAQSFLRAGLVDRVILVRAPVAFRQPLASGMTPEILQAAGLQRIGSYASGPDEIECWSRPHLDWPTEDLASWP